MMCNVPSSDFGTVVLQWESLVRHRWELKWWSSAHGSSNDVVEYDKSLSSPIIFSVCVCVCVCSAHNWHAGCSNMFARPCRMPLGICVSRLNMKWRHCHCQGLFGVRCLLKGLRFGHIHHIQISTLPHTALHSALHTTKCSRVNLTQALAQCICRLICAFTVHPTDNSFNYCHSPSRKRAPCSGCGEKTWTATKTKKMVLEVRIRVFGVTCRQRQTFWIYLYSTTSFAIYHHMRCMCSAACNVIHCTLFVSPRLLMGPLTTLVCVLCRYSPSEKNIRIHASANANAMHDDDFKMVAEVMPKFHLPLTSAMLGHHCFHTFLCEQSTVWHTFNNGDHVHVFWPLGLGSVGRVPLTHGSIKMWWTQWSGTCDWQCGITTPECPSRVGEHVKPTAKLIWCQRDEDVQRTGSPFTHAFDRKFQSKTFYNAFLTPDTNTNIKSPMTTDKYFENNAFCANIDIRKMIISNQYWMSIGNSSNDKLYFHANFYCFIFLFLCLFTRTS